MEDITQSLNFSPQNKRTKQKIIDELRKLIIDEMSSGSKPKKVAGIFKALSKRLVSELIIIVFYK